VPGNVLDALHQFRIFQRLFLPRLDRRKSNRRRQLPMRPVVRAIVRRRGEVGVPADLAVIMGMGHPTQARRDDRTAGIQHFRSGPSIDPADFCKSRRRRKAMSPDKRPPPSQSTMVPPLMIAYRT